MQQSWDPGAYGRHAAFVPELGAFLIDILDPRPGERILDLGCGDGELTREIARRGAHVVGLDASAAMVAEARRRGTDARVADGMRLTEDRAYDAVFSNAAIHWMPDHAAVFRGVARALRPGGRFVAECGAHGNVAAICTALRAVLAARGVRPSEPWLFASTAATETRLRTAGFCVDFVRSVPRPTPLPGELRDWLETFTYVSLAQFEADERARVLDEVIALLAPALRDDAGIWIADYVRLRWCARLPAAAVCGEAT